MVGFAVLGCGRIGKVHVRDMALHPRARPVMIYDVARPAAEATVAELEAKDPVLNFFVERYTEAYLAEINHFVDRVEKGATPLAGFAEGREALRLADAAVELLKPGRAVRVER